MYICIFVYTYGRTTNTFVYAHTDNKNTRCACVGMHAGMHICSSACMHVCIHACMHVCLYTLYNTCMPVRLCRS